MEHLHFWNLDFVGVVLPSEVVPRPTPAARLRAGRLGIRGAPLGQRQGVQEARVGLAQFRVIERLKQSEKNAHRLLKNPGAARAIRARLFKL